MYTEKNSDATMLTVTNSAQLKIKDLLAEEGNPELRLRVFVQGGGCSGFQYGFIFEDQKQDDDMEIEINDCKILIDAMSLVYLQGAIIDYVEELRGSYFSIKNPNATNTCGCGSSFSI